MNSISFLDDQSNARLPIIFISSFFSASSKSRNTPGTLIAFKCVLLYSSLISASVGTIPRLRSLEFSPFAIRCSEILDSHTYYEIRFDELRF